MDEKKRQSNVSGKKSRSQKGIYCVVSEPGRTQEVDGICSAAKTDASPVDRHEFPYLGG